MRILLNTKPSLLSQKTGIGYYVFNLYKELIKLNVDVTPTINKTSNDFLGFLSRLSCHLRQSFGKFYPNSLVRFIGDFLINRSNLSSAKTSAFDIYHETSLDQIPEINANIIFTLQDTIPFINDYQISYDKNFINYAQTNIRANTHKAKRIIVTTNFVKEEAIITLKIAEDKLDIIPLAPSSFFSLSKNSFMTKKNLKNITQKEYILYVGTVEPRKNLRTLIRSFKEIRNRYDISLVIAGRLVYPSDDIVSYPNKLGINKDVIFTGYVDEETLFHLYNNAKIFIFPSLYEGFGLPPLEAMACGTPVIISDIPPLKEIAGEAALTFDPKDFEELTENIRKILDSESLQNDMIKKGLHRVNEYSWEKTAALTIQTYKKALEN